MNQDSRALPPSASPDSSVEKRVANPLWVITIGMGVFFAMAAALLAAG